MKQGFIRTKNYIRLLDTVQQMEHRGAREASLILVTGVPALGKSAAVQRFAVDRGAAVFRAKATWTKRALLDEMADEFRVDKRGRNQEVQARLIKHIAAARTPLVFDEVQHMIGSTASALECVRDITDSTETLCILVAGTADVENRLSRFEQIASRIGAVVEFKALSDSDFVSLVKATCEVEVDKALMARLYEESQGKARLVLNGIAAIERTCKANGATKATAELMSGMALCQEWQGRRKRAGAAE